MVVFNQDGTVSFIYEMNDLFIVDMDVYKDDISMNSCKIGTFNSEAEAKECLEDMAFEYSKGTHIYHIPQKYKI